jgi:hypothetical protein
MTVLLQICQTIIHRSDTASAKFAGILGTGVVAWPNYTVIGWV